MIHALQSIPAALHLARGVYSAMYNGVQIHFAVRSDGRLVYAVALMVDAPLEVMVPRLADILDQGDPQISDPSSGASGARVLPFSRRRA